MISSDDYCPPPPEPEDVSSAAADSHLQTTQRRARAPTCAMSVSFLTMILIACAALETSPQMSSRLHLNLRGSGSISASGSPLCIRLRSHLAGPRVELELGSGSLNLKVGSVSIPASTLGKEHLDSSQTAEPPHSRATFRSLLLPFCLTTSSPLPPLLLIFRSKETE